MRLLARRARSRDQARLLAVPTKARPQSGPVPRSHVARSVVTFCAVAGPCTHVACGSHNTRDTIRASVVFLGGSRCNELWHGFAYVFLLMCPTCSLLGFILRQRIVECTYNLYNVIDASLDLK